MTLRLPKLERPRRRRTPHGDPEERFQFLVTMGFIGIIALVLLILVGALALNYYNANLRPVASVFGSSITRDEWVSRTDLTLFRLDRARRQLREAVAAGHIDQATADQRENQLIQASQNAERSAIDSLVDLKYQGQLAATRDISVTEAEVEAAIAEEEITPERRRIQVVFVEPETEEPGADPTAEEDAAAAEIAQEAFDALEDGFPFAQVAQQYSTDISRETGGEYGIITEENVSDPAWVEALFALEVDGTTEIVKGEDGIYRIGRVTEIFPEATDALFYPLLEQDLRRETYREQVRMEQLASKLREQVTDEVLAGPIEQVNVAEILIEVSGAEDEASGEGEVMAAHILYSPNGDPAGAAALDENDPAWDAAEEAAQATTDRLRAIAAVDDRIADFAETAQAESDDTGSGSAGGDLGWFPRTGQYVNELTDPLFEEETLVTGDIAGPFRTDFGYHVVLFQDRRGSSTERIAEVEAALAETDADFAEIAREYSDGDEAADGGALGWLIEPQLPPEAAEVLFTLEAGEVTDAIGSEDGFRFYQVLEREERPPDATQEDILGSTAFADWYDPQREAAEAAGDITLDVPVATEPADQFDPSQLDLEEAPGELPEEAP
ncbi:MAG: peptidylprolyl isomerase [Chloroflexota bacterium]|nr:peptidylprolyl isomerase [Chloroflexota bacterium]